MRQGLSRFRRPGAVCGLLLATALGAEPVETGRKSDAGRLSVEGFLHLQWRQDFHEFARPRYGFVLRRGRLEFRYDAARFGTEIEVGCDELNLTVKDAFAEYRVGRPLRLIAGLRKMPFSLEELTPVARLTMVERSEVNDLFGDYSYLGRDIGLTVEGELSGSRMPLGYALGVYNGNGDRRFDDINSAKQFVERLTFRPVPRLTLGANATQRNDSLTGKLVAAYGGDLQLRLPHGMIEAELLAGNRATGGRMLGGYVAGGYRLGAFELALRIEHLYPDMDDPSDAFSIVTLGGNWYLLRRVQLKANLVTDISSDRAFGHKAVLQVQAGF